MSELEDLRSENADQVIGPQLLQLLTRIVHATAPSYPPAEYSDAGVWNQAALEDACQDWTATRLLERGDLAVMLAAAGSVATLRSMLTRSFTQHLTNRRRRTSATNLFSRTVKLLRSEAVFAEVGSSRRSGAQQWTLADAPAEQPAGPGTVALLIKWAGTQSDANLGVVRYGPYSLKSSPILRGPALKEFVTALLGEADGYLSSAEIFEVMRHRFNLVELGPVELADSIVDTDPPTATAVETRLLAQSVVARLDVERIRLLRADAMADNNAQAAATAAGVAPADVHEATELCRSLIADYAETADQAIAVYRRVIESLFLEGEDS